MSTPLSDSELQQYTQLVDAILSTADLSTVTRKKVRKGLERALGGKDLSDQKEAIKDLIEARFDAISSQSQPTPPLQASIEDEPGYTPSPRKRERASIEQDDDENENGYHRRTTTTGDDYDDGDDDDNNSRDSAAPAAKKHKRASSSIEDADARLAAELQAQENRLARGRTTRGGSAGKATKPRKKAGSGSSSAKKKSAARVKDEDGSDGGGGGGGADSDASGGGGGVVKEKEKRKTGGGFQKPFNLSHHLAELVGETQLSRPQVVKKLWEHIKANELQDPTDKRQIRCDEKMQAVFKQQRIDMFQMNKHLGNHLYPVDEE